MSPLVATAAILALSHTAIGIDHSLPFIALARARGWGLSRTMMVTGVCGLAHVASSVVIGLGGWWLGSQVSDLAALDGLRGRFAGWLLLGFGVAYAAWGFRRQHEHPTGGMIDRRTTFWSLFLIFAFGPCEPLIPLLLYPALEGDLSTVAAVITVFSMITISTMLALVAAGWKGLQLLPGRNLERHAHTFAGLAVAASAAGILFMGL